MVACVVVALTNVTAQHQHTVCTLLKGAHNELGRDPPRAWNADIADISRGFQAGNARRIGTGVAAPGAQIGDYLGFKWHSTTSYGFRIPGTTGTTANAPIISLTICWSSKWMRVMALSRQVDAQVPHPLHRYVLTEATLSFSSMALYGQALTHKPQPAQRCKFTMATEGSRAIVPWSSRDRAAAA